MRVMNRNGRSTDVPGRVPRLAPRALLDDSERAIPCAPKVMEVVSTSALRITANHLHELETLAERGDVDEVRSKRLLAAWLRSRTSIPS